MLLFCCELYILTSLVFFSFALNQINFHVVNNKRLLSGSKATKSVRSALVCAALCTFDQRCCSSSYEEGSKLCRLETSCSQGMEHFQNSQVMIKDVKWIPMFVAFGGNGRPIYPAWTIQTECNDIQTPLDISVTTRHLRNPLMEKWGEVGVRKVKLQLFTNDVQVVWMLFNGENTNEMNWFSKENLLNSSFNDLTTSSTTNFFGIDGERDIQRRFFINRNYGDCNTDRGWFVIQGEFQACPWEQKGVSPVFLYTKNNLSRNWHTDCAEPADMMIISVGLI